MPMNLPTTRLDLRDKSTEINDDAIYNDEAIQSVSTGSQYGPGGHPTPQLLRRRALPRPNSL